MRKTLAVLALVAALSSCGSGKSESSAPVAEDTTATEVLVDSTTVAVDSAVVE